MTKIKWTNLVGRTVRLTPKANEWANRCGDDAGCPTRLRGGVELPGHGDYDCLFDAEAAGFLELGGTGLYPVITRFTERGQVVAAALRAHKAGGGSFGTFSHP